MKRAVKISLKFVTAKKLQRLEHLLRRYRKLTNRYIDRIWSHGGALDAATLNAVPCASLGYRQRSDCLRTALDTVASTRAAATATDKSASKPRCRGAIKFSALTAEIAISHGSFDYVLKISSVVSGQKLVLPFKSHARLNYWLAQPGAKLLKGCVVKGREAVLWIDVPRQPPKSAGCELGVDVGYNKLLADSQGNAYGQDIKVLCEKIRRKKPSSKAKQRARREREQYINRVCRQLPWPAISVIAVEDLTGLKTGKRPNRSKEFRKRMAPWTYRQALARITCLAQENRVLLLTVDPRNTSRECPICHAVSSENRRGEKFCCVRCGHMADADQVGAQNIIARTRGNSRQSMVAGS